MAQAAAALLPISQINARTPAPSPTLAVMTVHDAVTPAPRQPIGAMPGDWASLEPAGDDTRAGTLKIPGAATYTYPQGPLGARYFGFDLRDDGTFDWRPYELLEFQVKLPAGRVFDGLVTISVPHNPDTSAPGSFPTGKDFPYLDYLPRSQARFQASGDGWQAVSIPISSFDYPRAQEGFLKFIQQVRIGGTFADGKNGSIEVRNVTLLRGQAVVVDAPVKGKTADAGETAEYPVTVTNTTPQPQDVVLSMHGIGWETSPATVEPSAMALGPGESKPATVRVTVNPRVAPGGFEKDTLVVVPTGAPGAKCEVDFLTARRLPAPYILHTKAGWKDVLANASKYTWAKAQMDKLVTQAREWKMPPLGVKSEHSLPEWPRRVVMKATDTDTVRDVLVPAYCLTGDREIGGKIASVLRAFSDPKTGYPTMLALSDQSLVQEGGAFQNFAIAYDAIQDDGFLTDAEKRNIEWCFRRYMEIIDDARSLGTVSNWQVAENTGALFCALALQDRERINHWLYAPSGVIDQMVKGTTDDGWWYEMSVSYNTWVASENTQVALAVKPFGIDIASTQFPASYSATWDLRPFFNPPAGQPLEQRFQGRWQQIGGPTTRNIRAIRDLWDGPLAFIDYRGVIFGINDSTERRVGGEPYELAYSVFRDPKYAEMIHRLGGERNLLYGVPELPDPAPSNLSTRSAYADNAGVAMLRSQTPNRPQREQIQAVIKYSTQGGSHGHYDRNDLLSIMRYGRSFWSPESVWYSYGTPLYVMLAQSSPMHNMVVADQKTQEPVDSPRLLFHSGPMMQAVATESLSRFAYPPVLSGWERWKEMDAEQNRPIPMPEKLPQLGMMFDATEQLLQRRAMIVTDDYIVVADYVKGEKEHTYDWLLHPQGFIDLEGPGKRLVKQTAFMTDDPFSSARFIVDAKWYDIGAPSLARFSTVFPEKGREKLGAGGSSPAENEPGPLNLDVYSLWPRQQRIMIAKSPVNEGGEAHIGYAVQGSGRTLDKGEFDSWILGKRDIDVPVQGIDELVLQTTTNKTTRNTIFWGNARIVTVDGQEIPLSSLSPKLEGIVPNPTPGRDYYGGPVVIEGVEYANSLGGQPVKVNAPGTIRVNLAGQKAARFKATLGVDFSTADARTERKVFASRVKGTEARFLTVIEPYEDKPMIKSAAAASADKLRVELADGRVQEIAFRNFTGSGKDISVRITEFKNGKALRSETSVPQSNSSSQSTK